MIKAFGWQLQEVDLRASRSSGKAPAIALHGLPGNVLDLSVSHDGDYAIAVALVE